MFTSFILINTVNSVDNLTYFFIEFIFVKNRLIILFGNSIYVEKLKRVKK